MKSRWTCREGGQAPGLTGNLLVAVRNGEFSHGKGCGVRFARWPGGATGWPGKGAAGAPAQRLRGSARKGHRVVSPAEDYVGPGILRWEQSGSP